MNDKELREIIIKSKVIAEQSRKEFEKSINSIKKAQQNIMDAI